MAPNKPKADDEDIALQDAIKASLRDSTSNPPIKLEDDAASSSAIEMQALPKRVNIDDRIKDIALRAAIELPLVHEAGGDTWVFIDPPPMQPEQDQLDYAGYIKRYVGLFKVMVPSFVNCLESRDMRQSSPLSVIAHTDVSLLLMLIVER